MKKHLFFAATAALALASCSSDSVDFTQADVLQAQDDNSVQFDTYMGKTGTTRVDYAKGPIDNSDTDQGLKNAKFGVFAYNTSAETDAGADYNPASINATPSNIAPNFMYNQKITWSASSPTGWVYNPVKYWPNGLDAANTHQGSGESSQKKFQKLSFFAYAPYKEMSEFNTAGTGTFPTQLGTTSAFKTISGIGASTNGIVGMTTNAFKGNVWVKYLMPKAQEDEAVDLLWGLRGSASYSETDNSANAGTVGTDYNINLTKQIVGEKVAFLFKHALTKIGGQTTTTEDVTETPGSPDKIGFKIVADVDVNTEATTGDHDNQATYFGTDFNKDQTLITLKSIKIQDGKTATDDTETSVTGYTTNSGIYNSGWFNIETGSWEGHSITGEGSKISIVAKSEAENQANTTDEKYSINPDIREAASYSNSAGSGVKKLASGDLKWDETQKPTGIYTTAVPVFAKETVPGITLIPGGSAQKIYITVDYLVRTADPNLENGYSVVEQVISNEINLSSLQSNKYYTIIIHLGMTSVKFEAVVADWQTTVNGTYTDDGTFTPGSGGDANPIESHIWLPSNVVTP